MTPGYLDLLKRIVPEDDMSTVWRRLEKNIGTLEYVPTMPGIGSRSDYGTYRVCMSPCVKS